IELHLNHLGVAGFVRTNIFIRWIVFCPACVADRRGKHAFQIAKSFFNPPETTCAECGFLRLHTRMMMRLRAGRNLVVVFVDSNSQATASDRGSLRSASLLQYVFSTKGGIHV